MSLMSRTLHVRSLGAHSIPTWFAAACTLVVFLLLSVLLSGTAGAAPVKITFWHGAGGEHGRVLDQLVNEFNASQDEVLVESAHQGGYGTLMQKLLASVAAGDPPTLAWSFNNWTSQFIDGDAIVPMEEFINDPEIGYSDDELSDFFPAFIEANSWNGTLYTLPFNKSVQILYYNQELLDKAGISVPTTMDELADAARKVKAETEIPGLAVVPGIDTFAAYFRAFGGEWLDEEGQPAFNDEAGVRAFEFIQALIEDQAAYVYDGYLDDEFNKGRTAMFIHSNGTVPWVRQSATFPWGTAPVPAGTRPASTVAGLDLAIFREATQAEQRAAWTFTKWLLSPEVNARWSAAAGYLPVRQSTLETPSMQAYLQEAAHEKASGIESLDRLVFDPGIPAWNDMRNFVSEAVEKVLLLGTDPQQALDEAVQKSKQAILDYL